MADIDVATLLNILAPGYTIPVTNARHDATTLALATSVKLPSFLSGADRIYTVDTLPSLLVTPNAVTMGGGVLRGPPEIMSKTSGTTSGAQTSITLSKPSGVQVGDLLLATFAARGSGIEINPQNRTWTWDRHQESATVQAEVFARIATSDEPSTYTWNFDSSRKVCGAIFRIGTCTPSVGADGPYLNMVKSSNDGDSVTANVSSGAASKNLVLWVVASDSAVSGIPDSGYTEEVDISTTTPNASSLYVMSKKNLTTDSTSGDQVVFDKGVGWSAIVGYLVP